MILDFLFWGLSCNKREQDRESSRQKIQGRKNYQYKQISCMYVLYSGGYITIKDMQINVSATSHLLKKIIRMAIQTIHNFSHSSQANKNQIYCCSSRIHGHCQPLEISLVHCPLFSCSCLYVAPVEPMPRPLQTQVAEIQAPAVQKH